jgi:hypothetical protein
VHVSVQPPPGHVSAQLSVAVQDSVQLPPPHVMQTGPIAPGEHVGTLKHEPPGQLVMQLLPVAHAKMQEPPGQPKVQVAPELHCWMQLPPGHSNWHVWPELQVPELPINVQLTRTFVTLALFTVPVPALTVQGPASGWVSTVTSYGLPFGSGGMNVNGPLVVMVRLLAPLSCKTTESPVERPSTAGWSRR